MAGKLFAAIDVGSYEIELAIYEIIRGREIRRIDHVRHVLALGRESYHNGRISMEMIGDLCDTISGYAEIMRSYGVTEYVAYATSAMREASNRQIVLDQVRVRTGISVSVINNSEQRFMYYKALAVGSDQFEKMIQEGTLIVDVGFGSVQISLYDKGHLITTQNVRLGALRIREMLSDSEGNTININRLIEELVDNDLSTFRMLYLKDRKIRHMIAIGNNILYFLKSPESGVPFDESGRITQNEFRAFHARMLSRSPRELAERFNMPEDFTTLMFPGAMVYARVLEMTSAEEVWVPSIRFVDGMAADHASNQKLISLTHDFTADILWAAHAISKRYMDSAKHTEALEKNACAIFDGIKKYHGLGRREKLLLRIATILHDCGKYISMSSSALSAYQIIMATEIIGLSHREREIVANVVKFNTLEYHFDLSEPGSKLRKEDETLILKLTAILRVANAMDRSHRQKFETVSVRPKGRELQIINHSDEDISLEKALFRQKADFFEEVYGIRPVLKSKKGE